MIATKPAGGTWDTSSPSMPNAALPDPFCEFQINEVGRRDSMVLTDTLSPNWGESITPPNVRLTSNWLMSQAGMWSILVGDYDGMNNEEICQVFPTLTPANFSSGTVVFSNNRACARLSIQLTCDE